MNSETETNLRKLRLLIDTWGDRAKAHESAGHVTAAQEINRCQREARESYDVIVFSLSLGADESEIP